MNMEEKQKKIAKYGGMFYHLGSLRNLQFPENFHWPREPYCFLDMEGSSLIIKDGAQLNSGVYIWTHSHQFEKSNWRELGSINSDKPTVIEENAFLGCCVIILSSCKRIGKCSVIGAGAVVTRDIPDYESCLHGNLPVSIHYDVVPMKTKFSWHINISST